MAEETNLNGAYLHVHDQVVAQVRETLPPEQTLSDLAELFKIFGDATRIRILLVLFQSEVCVYDLAKLLNMTQSAISHQLRLLKQARLVKSRREGKIVFYSLADSHVPVSYTHLIPSLFCMVILLRIIKFFQRVK